MGIVPIKIQFWKKMWKVDGLSRGLDWKVGIESDNENNGD